MYNDLKKKKWKSRDVTKYLITFTHSVGYQYQTMWIENRLASNHFQSENSNIKKKKKKELKGIPRTECPLIDGLNKYKKN